MLMMVMVIEMKIVVMMNEKATGRNRKSSSTTCDKEPQRIATERRTARHSHVTLHEMRWPKIQPELHQ